MEGYSRKDGECPQLLDLIPKGSNKWVEKTGNVLRRHGDGGVSSEEDQNKLELSLGLPGDSGIKDKTIYRERRSRESLLSLGSFSSSDNPTCLKNQVLRSAPLLDPVMKECSQPQSQPCNNSSAAQKWSASGPVVGWPPVRTFRKTITNGNCSKSSPANDSCPKPGESSCPRSLFVKVNMDGIPIGRKLDLRKHNSYERLPQAVDELFRDLLPAGQREPCVGGVKDKKDGKGIGDYTLVYEDNEGDRMLVGDVPWHMFVSTVKRLRMLKSSELPKLSGGKKQGLAEFL